MIVRLLLEGIGLGVILILICCIGIKDGAVGMVQLYHKEVQERCVDLGLTTYEKIKRRAIAVRIAACILYLAYLIVCAYIVNGARGFWQGFWQMFAILSVMNLIDRFLIDEYWVGHTKMWVIPGTEDLRPYIDNRDKVMKWLSGTVGMALAAALVAGIMALII